VTEAAGNADARSNSSPDRPRLLRWGIAAILVVASVVRFTQLNAQSLTSDEVKDLGMARGGIVALAESEDRFPPLYHALLGVWLRVIPWDVTGRGFSAVCGVLTVAAIAGLADILGGRKAAIWAGGIAALAPLALWYSVEARAYGLYMLLATIALWQFTAAMKFGEMRHWAAFAVASIAGAYTHYYFGLLIALTGFVWLGSLPRGERLRRGLTTFALIAAGTAPSLWLLKNDLDQPWGYARTSRFSIPALGYTYFSYLSGYTLGPSLRELHTMTPGAAAVAAAQWLIVVGAATAVLLTLGLRHLERRQRMYLLACLAVFWLAPAAIIGAVSDAASFGYNVRHAVWAFAPLAAALGIGASHGRPRWLAWAAVCALGVAFVFAHINRLTTLAHANEDMRGAAAFLVDHGAPAPTFVLSGYMRTPLVAYLPANWTATALLDAGTDRNAATRIRKRVGAGQRFWLVYTREFHGDPRGEALSALQGTFHLERVATLAGVRVYRGQVDE